MITQFYNSAKIYFSYYTGLYKQFSQSNKNWDIALTRIYIHVLPIYRASMKILMARVLAEEMPSLQWLKKCIPDVIPHRFDHIMARKSEQYPMFVSESNSFSFPQIDSCLMNHDIYFFFSKKVFDNRNDGHYFRPVVLNLWFNDFSVLSFKSFSSLVLGLL